MARKNEYENQDEEEIIEETDKIEESDEVFKENNEETSSNSNSNNFELELEEMKAKYLRLQAEFMNYRKRTEKEKQGMIKYGIETFVCGLLPILDNFQRATESERDKDDEFFKGVKMIESQIVELLKKNGVVEIPSMDEEFDPNYHHAIVQEEVEGVDTNIVTGILQKGYKLDDKVIRPSMVKVSK